MEDFSEMDVIDDLVASTCSGHIQSNLLELTRYSRFEERFMFSRPHWGKAGDLQLGHCDRFFVGVPYCLKQRTWGVICLSKDDYLIPDFILEELAFIPDLRSVNEVAMEGGSKVLLKSILVLLDQYKKFELATVLKNLKNKALVNELTELIDVVGKERVTVDSSELIEYAHGAITVTVRIDYDAEGNVLKEASLLDDDVTYSSLVVFSFVLMELEAYECYSTFKPHPKLKGPHKALDNLDEIGSLAQKLEHCERLFEKDVVTPRERLEMSHRELLARALVASFRESVLEYDSDFTKELCAVCLLLCSRSFYGVVKILIPRAYPHGPVKASILSIYHNDDIMRCPVQTPINMVLSPNDPPEKVVQKLRSKIHDLLPGAVLKKTR
eukprot:Nk52_evm2s1129 gene=Nk52_evmTU2s1129